MGVGNSTLRCEVRRERQAAGGEDRLSFIVRTKIYLQHLGLSPAPSVSPGFMFSTVCAEVKAALL